MRRVRKGLAFLLALVLVATGMQTTGMVVNAETTETLKEEISSLQYEITVSNPGEETSFTWIAQAESGEELKQVVPIQEGTFSFTVSLDTAQGMKNLGFVEQIEDSKMQIEVSKITVNKEYALTFDSNPVLKAGTDNENGLANIWNVSAETKICSSHEEYDEYLAKNQDDEAIYLYRIIQKEDSSDGEESTNEEPTNEEPKEVSYSKQEITSFHYYVIVEKSGDSSSFEWTTQTASWKEPKQTVELSGDGTYDFTVTYDDESGMKNLGYLTVKAGSEMTVTVEKIVVNDTYELTFETAPVLLEGVENSNGLPHVWGSIHNTPICSSDKAYLESDGNQGTIYFYVAGQTSSDPDDDPEEEDPKGEENEDYEVENIYSIRYETEIANSNGTTSLTWIAQDSDGTTFEQDITIDGDETCSFTVKTNEALGIRNLGYINIIDGSEMTMTIEKIVFNEKYELAFETAKVLYAGVNYGNGLPNIWSTLEEQEIICKNDDAYLAFSSSPEKMLKLYVKKQEGDQPIADSDASLRYVEAMGSGWNLGNSFDGFDSDTTKEDAGELAWGNPTVTRELIHAIKEKGYDSIRMPMTVYRRYTVKEDAGEGEYKYVINEDWLARYKEVVDWAVEEGLYVMVNIHHDSWIWLSKWDGNQSSEEYRMYTDFWKQLAAYLAEEPEQVCFETINEPDFSDGNGMTAQEKLDAINLAAYHIIRETAGNEERMIVLPTLATNHERCAPLYRLIESLNDNNIIATVHYYSEWVYSANLGKTGFDEELWDNNGESYTPRVAAQTMMSTIKKQFLDKKIGVIIGEYGLLGYDQSEGCLQTGEELKYYEYVNELARQNKVCLMFWDNGSGINRNDANYAWKKAVVGDMLTHSMSERSSYATGLDTLYLEQEVQEDVQIPLTLNGNTFKGIDGLTEGTDYTYDSANAVVVLKKEYVNTKFAQKTGYGTFAELVMKFDGGADWHEYLVKYAAPTVGKAEGTKADGIQVPVDFHGSKVRRVTAYQAGGKVGPNSSWWNYLQYDSSFGVDYEKGTISLLNSFFADETVKDGLMKLKVEYFDGTIDNIWLEVTGSKVVSDPSLAGSADDISVSDIICLYVGETAIPQQYLNMPEGGSVYGTWIDNTTEPGMVTLQGWPGIITFDTKAHENFVSGGLVLYYMDKEAQATVSIGIKEAPSVEAAQLRVSQSQKLIVNNLSDEAEVTYLSSDSSVVQIAKDGTMTAKKEGTATITVTVKQYQRSDDWEAEITVKGTAASSGQSQNNNNNNNNNNNQNSSTSTPSSSSSTTTASAQTTTPAAGQQNQGTTIPEDQVALAPSVTTPGASDSVVAQDRAETVIHSINNNSNKENNEDTQETQEEEATETQEQMSTDTQESQETEESQAVDTSSEETGEVSQNTPENAIDEEATPLAQNASDAGSKLPVIMVVVVLLVMVAGVTIIMLRKKEESEL